MINAIAEKFSFETCDDDAVDVAAPRCECGSQIFWQPKNQIDWRCVKCSPPVSRALVGEWNRDGAELGQSADLVEPEPTAPPAPVANSSATVVGEFVVTCCRPWCERCRGWQGREIVWSDGSTSLRCRTCGAVLPEWPEVKPMEVEIDS